MVPGVGLKEAKEEGWLKGAPQKYNFAKEPMVRALEERLEKVFGKKLEITIEE